MTQPNTVIKDQAAYEAALALCEGVYQIGIIEGTQCLSGADLRGKAKEYGASYARSRRNLLRLMTWAEVPWHEMKGKHGKRILVIGESDPAA